MTFGILNLFLDIDLAVDHGDVARREVVLALSTEGPRLLLAAKTVFDLRLLVIWLLVHRNGVCQLAVEGHEILMVCTW